MDLLIQQLAQELSLNPTHVEAVVTLLDEGNTIPFIARYRKEAHGSMSDDVLRDLADRLNYLRNLSARREEIRKAIQTQGKLTAALSAKLNKADTLAKLEDLYRPYRPKRRTRATMAKEKGLEPLAAALLFQQKDSVPEALAVAYVDADKGVKTVKDALAGASDILAESISDDADTRNLLREELQRHGRLTVRAAQEEDSVYRNYYEFDQPVSRLQGHQVLAIKWSPLPTTPRKRSMTARWPSPCMTRRASCCWWTRTTPTTWAFPLARALRFNSPWTRTWPPCGRSRA